ncbi:MAG: hypothetical protein ACRDI0_05310 [Actinomycetota bacterium]
MTAATAEALRKERLWERWMAVVVFLLPIALAVFLSVLPAPAPEGGDYPYGESSRFLRLCQGAPGRTPRECGCMLRQLRAELPFERFAEEDLRIVRGSPSADVAAIIEPCLPPPEPVPAD